MNLGARSCPSPNPPARLPSNYGRGLEHEPQCVRLAAQTARVADRLNAPWYAVYVQTPSEDLTRIDAATQRMLSKTLELAQQLGGIPMTFRGPDIASTMWAFAQEYAIKVIVIGKSRQPWYRRLTPPRFSNG